MGITLVIVGGVVLEREDRIRRLEADGVFANKLLEDRSTKT